MTNGSAFQLARPSRIQGVPLQPDLEVLNDQRLKTRLQANELSVTDLASFRHGTDEGDIE